MFQILMHDSRIPWRVHLNIFQGLYHEDILTTVLCK